MVITQSGLIKNICFYKYAHNSGPRGFPDMIFSTFDVIFSKFDVRYLPGPVDL